MKYSTFITFSFLFSLFSLGLTSCGSGCSCGISAEDEAFFKTQIEQSQNDWNNGDRTAYSNRYAENAVLMPANQKALKGASEIAEFLNGFPAVTASFNPEEILGSCEMAMVRGTYSLTLEDGTQADIGKWMEIWQKNEEGGWELTRDIFNSDLPLPVPEEPSKDAE